jgi:hypothetical protein
MFVIELTCKAPLSEIDARMRAPDMPLRIETP